MDQSTRPEGKVLIVDDESSLRRALHTTLYGLGFDIGEASSGDEAIALCRIVRYDAVLLDVNMPGKSGIETCAELRRLLPRVAILMLSVNDDQDRKVEALEAGADDYVTKPFHMRELTARIRAALRRARIISAHSEETILIGEISLHPARRLVQKAGQPVHLTPKEFDLLHYLMAHSGLPITHARLLHVVWGAEYASQVEYLRTFMRQLRRKLEDDAGNPRYLLTDSHVGYRFADPAQFNRTSESSPALIADPVEPS
jgi:two-component system KDP operon response regulator KdpE